MSYNVFTPDQFKVGTMSYLYGLSGVDGSTVSWTLRAIEMADRLSSKLDKDATCAAVKGMSGRKNRHLLNNICSRPETRYLEVGLWKGSTFFSALYLNRTKAYGIDNWSEFDGEDARSCFYSKLASNLDLGLNDVEIADGDFFKADFGDRKFDVFLYDGAHDEESQRLAMVKGAKLIDGPAVFIIDDWKQEEVRRGTYRGLEEAGLVQLLRFSSPYFIQGSDAANWWDGYYVCVVSPK